MQRRVRQILLASLLALYGALTACGPALHWVPGADHVKYGSPGKGDGPDHPTGPHHDCPVCHFLAQGQITADPAQILSMDVVRIQPGARRVADGRGAAPFGTPRGRRRRRPPTTLASIV